MSARCIKLVATLSVLLVVVFTSSCSDGTAPPPAKPTKLMLVTQPSTTAETMVPLATQPVVQVVDAAGNAIAASATITAKVISGNGAVVTSGSATTNEAGLATFAGLTLGAVSTGVGPLTLEFSASGLTSATANVELHCALRTLALGQTFSGAITSGDCARSGILYHVFRLATSQPVSGIGFTYDGPFREGLFVRGANEPSVAWGFTSPVGSPTPIHFNFRVLLPAGNHDVTVAAMDPGTTGSYTVAAVTEPEDLSCSTLAFAASPITTTQHLATGDCKNTSSGAFEDNLFVGLPAGAVLTAALSSTEFGPEIRLYNGNTGNLAAGGDRGQTSLTFTNPTGQPAAAYALVLTSATAVTGAYTLTLNVTYPAGILAGESQLNLPVMEMSRLTRAGDVSTATGKARSAAWLDR
ncbi:MAG: hypothetical protein ACJ8AF_07735 [Gemmatimonadaceae bacterium]